MSILGVLHRCRCTDGGEIWRGGGDLRRGPLHAKFHPHRCNVSPLRGEKPQNRPLSKLNTGRFALRAMLPVNRIRLFTKILPGLSNLPYTKRLEVLGVDSLDICRLRYDLVFTARIASAVLATAIPSVRLSVRLSVTRRYCVKTTVRSTVQFALLDSKMCLVL